jgi:signal transduction histidine kinase
MRKHFLFFFYYKCLGLSFSYDIIKACGGELKVETRGSDYTEFTFVLPG